MKVLMLGWEFPPYFAGGVGIVCYELTKALSNLYDDLEIEYVMAYGPKNEKKKNNFKIDSAANVEEMTSLKKISVTEVSTYMKCYDSMSEYKSRYDKVIEEKAKLNDKDLVKTIYGANILREVELYAQRVVSLCVDKDFDVIHAHDWTTIPAALLLKKLTGKPIVLHVHITEFDKTGGLGGHEEIFNIEKRGFQEADILVPVSNFTKLRLIHNYGIDPQKIMVIHNGGVTDNEATLEKAQKHIFREDKIVLFAGRITMQKGPEYFLYAAKKVLEHAPETKFAMIGGGDQLGRMLELADELEISHAFFFNKRQFTRDEADQFFSMSDCFVMPSISEPFGIVPLEAVAKGTPAIISKQSGISEVLNHSFKVDFWDIDEMAHKILALIKYPTLNSHMREEAHNDIHKFSWDIPAEKFYNLYRSLQ